jgi:hypothetical protein
MASHLRSHRVLPTTDHHSPTTYLGPPPLPRRRRRRLEAVLQPCRNFSAYLEQIRVTIRLTGAIEPDDLSPRALAELTELYRRWRIDS